MDIYLYTSNTLYTGCNTNLGSSKSYCAIKGNVNLLEWTHIAATYDASDAIWRIYINGQLSNVNPRAGNIRAGPKKSNAPWIIGSIPNKPFYGQICDVRIWSTARTEEQIKKCMKIDNNKNINLLNQILDDTNLRGFWPLNDGVGLLCADISKYKHYGFAKDCTWKNAEKRPFKCSYHKAEVGGDKDKKMKKKKKKVIKLMKKKIKKKMIKK